jgi:hypothetical protein
LSDGWDSDKLNQRKQIQTSQNIKQQGSPTTDVVQGAGRKQKEEGYRKPPRVLIKPSRLSFCWVTIIAIINMTEVSHDNIVVKYAGS